MTATKKTPAKATKKTRYWFCDDVDTSVSVSDGRVYLCAQNPADNYSFAFEHDQALALASEILKAAMRVKP